MFGGCTSLQSVPALACPVSETVQTIFNGCSSLKIITEIDLSRVRTVAGNNASIGSASQSALNVAKAVITGNRYTQTFQNCGMGATELDEMYTSLAVLNPNVTNVTGTGSVVTYTVDDIRPFYSVVTNRTVTITGVDPVAYNLTSVTAANATFTTGNAGTFTVTNSATGTYVSGGVATIQDNKTITVTGNPGTGGDDPTIATNKGWTVTGS